MSSTSDAWSRFQFAAYRLIPHHSVSCTLRNGTSVPNGIRIILGVRHSHGVQESDEEFDARYEAYFSRPDIDGWEVRKAMNDLQGYDLIPEPRIIIAAMKACRRVNDYALAVRYLEAIQDKCGNKVKEIWPYISQQIDPTLKDLGILTPEEMGYNKPELALKDVYDM